MKIAITGANGFVGAALCRYFYKKGHEIIAIGNQKNPSSNLLKVARYISADITGVMQEIDADVCIHAAALSSDNDTYRSLILRNVEGTLNVVEAARKCRFFVHISSSSVYQFTNHPLTEDEACIQSDLSDYGETKLLAEDIVELEIPDNQKRLILRPRAIYGVGDPILLPRLLSLVKGKFFFSPFNRHTQSSLTHVDNIGYAIELFMKQPDPPQLQIFNITDEKPYLLKQLALDCTSSLHKRKLVPVTLPASLMRLFWFLNSYQSKSNDNGKPALSPVGDHSVLDISRIKEVLKYKPSKDFYNSYTEITSWVDSFGNSTSYMKRLSDAPLECQRIVLFCDNPSMQKLYI